MRVRLYIGLLFCALFSSQAVTPASAQQCLLAKRTFQSAAATVAGALGAQTASDGAVTVRVTGAPGGNSKLVDVQPAYGAVRFANKRALLFKFSDSRPLNVLEAYATVTDCNDQRAVGSYPRRGGDILLGDETARSPERIGIRRSKALSRVVYFSGGSAPSAWTRTLVETPSRIDVIGISLPNIEDSVRTLMTVSRRADGTLTIGRYYVQLRP